jgi:hypothetical protein
MIKKALKIIKKILIRPCTVYGPFRGKESYIAVTTNAIPASLQQDKLHCVHKTDY